MGNRLQNKVAIVTGAGRGIGKEIVSQFLREGCSVAAISRGMESLEQAKHEIFDKIAPERVMIHQLDIVHKEDVKTMVQCVKERFGRVDILVNNAGANFFDEPVTLSDEIW